MCFSQGGKGLPCPPFLAVLAPFDPVSLRCMLCMVVVFIFRFLGLGWMRGDGAYSDPWCAYLNSLSPAPSSHCGRCTLIRCAGTRDPRMQQWLARTKVIAILLLTYPHVFEWGCFHLVARRLADLFKVAVASTPSSPSTEAAKGEKCRLFWRHASRYIRFFPLSASCRHFSGSLVMCYLASVFTTRVL